MPELKALAKIENYYQVYSKHLKNIDNNQELTEYLIQYFKVFPDAVYENVWWDNNSRSFLSAGHTLENPQSGINHHFINNQKDFLNKDFNRSCGWVQNHYDILLKQCPYKEFINTEIRVSINEAIAKIFSQNEVFIVGGGPSTNSIDFKEFEDVPKWTMNNFFLNDKLRNLNNIQLVTLLDDSDIENNLLWECVHKNKPLILQEITDIGHKRIKKIKENYDNMTCMLTRYRSRLGIGPRLIILAIMLGIKNIYISGFDGYVENKTGSHSFEKDKDVPRWFKIGGENLQSQQFLIFWTYILDLQKIYNFKIHDLTKDSESVQYKFMQEYL